ncbi:MAG: tRNA lysidine(34) synthetase TilS [Clostridia bacterium]|nr:tRNA lysidine(34) synthetase TilS [Clostridia bacterium]
MMREAFQKEWDAFSLPKDCRVTVALSGGMDSVTLLYLLKELPARDFSLEAVHVHHGLREAADEDAAFCQSLCKEWQIPLTVFRGDARAYAKERGMSLEEGARALRYGFLAPYADGVMNFVATAHHREDRQETFFINLYRGSGSRGLAGIAPRRDGYLRPMLKLPKAELVAFAEAEGLRYVTDETNADTAYLRNFLRHRVLPLLQSREEGDFAKGLSVAMEALREEDEALCQWAEQVQDDKVETLAALPNAVLKRVLDRMNGGPLTRLHFAEIAELIRRMPPAGQVQLAEERYFRLEYGRCVFTDAVGEPCLRAEPGVPVIWKDQQFLVRLEDFNSPFTHFTVDCDKISGNLIFRHKRPGDVFKPAGSGGTSRLQKRLKNDRVPRSRRDALWVLADERDRVVWVEGYGAAEEFCCSSSTKRVYCIEIRGIIK